MIAHESQRSRRGCGAAVLAFQSEGTEKQEHRHPIVTEERQQMERQQCVGGGQCLVQPGGIVPEKLVFVLFHHGPQPVAIVVQEDAENGQTAQRVALGAAQELVVDSVFHASKLVVSRFGGYFLSRRAASWRARSRS